MANTIVVIKSFEDIILKVNEFENTILRVTPFEDQVVIVPGTGEDDRIFDFTFDEKFE